MFVFKGFSHPKDPQNGVNEDAWRADDLQNVVVVSDGASSSLFSSSWANILCQSVIECVPDPMDHFNFPKWLERVREKWVSGIDFNNLSWYQKPKMASGAFATLVWATIEQSMEAPDDLDDDTPLDTDFFRIFGYALGDACLLHFHNGRLVRSIPVVRSEDFDSTPPLVGSVNLGVDLTASFVPIDFIVPEGDWIILATDAMSQWILAQCENGSTPHWREFWNQTPEQYDELVERIRQEQQIRVDDSTVLLCCVGSDVFLDREFNVELSTPVIRQEETRFSSAQEYVPEPPAPPAPAPSAPAGKTVSVSDVFLDFPDAAPMPPIPPRPIPPVPQPEPEPVPSSAKTGFHQTTEIPPLPEDELGIDSDYGIPNSLPKSDNASAFRVPQSGAARPAAPKQAAPKPAAPKQTAPKPTASKPVPPRPAAPKRIQPSQEQRIEPPKSDEEEYKVAQPQPGSETRMSPYMAELERRKVAEIEQEEQRKKEQESKFSYQFQKGMAEGIQDMKEGLSDLINGPVGEQAKEAMKKGKEKVAKFFGRLFKKGKEGE